MFADKAILFDLLFVLKAGNKDIRCGGEISNNENI
jgi:hypothetical protein